MTGHHCLSPLLADPLVGGLARRLYMPVIMWSYMSIMKATCFTGCALFDRPEPGISLIRQYCLSARQMGLLILVSSCMASRCLSARC